MLKTCFPERLKQLRRDAGMLQADLAEHFKVSKSAVSGWEVGRNQPSYDILIEMSILFGVTVDYLLCREDRRLLDISALSDEEAAAVCSLVELLKKRTGPAASDI